MSRLENTISSIVKAFAERRRIRVGVIYNGNRPVAEHVLLCGQRTLVISDRFHSLFRLFRGFNNGDSHRVMMVESRLDALPVAPRSLDLLVVSAGLPRSADPRSTLETLRDLIKPGGLFVWTHPSEDGALTRFASGLSGRRGPAMRQPDLCKMAMAAGFCEIGQTAVSHSLSRWVVTTGRRGDRPWERAPWG